MEEWREEEKEKGREREESRRQVFSLAVKTPVQMLSHTGEAGLHSQLSFVFVLMQILEAVVMAQVTQLDKQKSNVCKCAGSIN